MNVVYRLTDCPIKELIETEYDIAIFASGYESRSIYCPSFFTKNRIQDVAVFGFKEVSDNDQRKTNDRYFNENWTESQIILGADEDDLITDYLSELDLTDKEYVRILIDYSSMSRLWYANILNWARFATSVKSVFLDFVYAVGRHIDQNETLLIKDSLPIPGCEGAHSPDNGSVAVFGLGFHETAALAIYDQLQPDAVYTFYASPGSFMDYSEMALERNSDLVKIAKKSIGLPLGSVETTFRALTEVISPFRTEYNITFIPMGPKPHVLASILLSMRFKEISCLRVNTERRNIDKKDSKIDVVSAGTIVTVRVEIRPDRLSGGAYSYD